MSEDERPEEGMWKLWPEAEVRAECVLVFESRDMPDASTEEKGAWPVRICGGGGVSVRPRGDAL